MVRTRGRCWPRSTTRPGCCCWLGSVGGRGPRIVLTAEPITDEFLVRRPVGELTELVRIADGRRFPLPGPAVLIGPGPDTDLVLGGGLAGALLSTGHGWRMVALAGAAAPVLVDGVAVIGDQWVGLLPVIRMAGRTTGWR
jgi:hypothetical protein